MIRVAIVLCDDLGRRISTQYAPYETLYVEFLNLAAPDVLETSVFRAHKGDLPDDVTLFDAVVIGGSRASVHETHEWIPPLLSVVRSSLESDMSTWGICFGHQVVAAAMGADVGPSTIGWNLGAQRSRPRSRRRKWHRLYRSRGSKSLPLRTNDKIREK